MDLRRWLHPVEVAVFESRDVATDAISHQGLHAQKSPCHGVMVCALAGRDFGVELICFLRCQLCDVAEWID